MFALCVCYSSFTRQSLTAVSLSRLEENNEKIGVPQSKTLREREEKRETTKSGHIEDLTLVGISYEMTTSVRFCLSYDLFKPFLK